MSFDRGRELKFRADRDGSQEAGSPRAGVGAIRHALASGESDPATVARLILAHSDDRDAMLILLHQTAGNAFVHQVLDVMRQVRADGTESEGVGRVADRSANATETALSGFSGASREVPYRAEMESAFGESFGDVRSHHGPDARRASTALDARAFAVQNDQSKLLRVETRDGTYDADLTVRIKD